MGIVKSVTTKTLFCSGIRQLESSENFEIPTDIIESWNQAVKCRSRAAKNAVFQAFLRSGKDWSKLLGAHDVEFTGSHQLTDYYLGFQLS